jgi:hypothetical protein
MCSKWEGWLSPVEGTRLESEKAGFSEVCKILRIVSNVAPLNDLRAIALFKSFRCFAGVFTKIGADRRNGPYKLSPQSEALNSLVECLIVQRLMGFFYGFLDGILMISIASRMEQPPALADEYCFAWKRRTNRTNNLLSTTA